MTFPILTRLVLPFIFLMSCGTIWADDALNMLGVDQFGLDDMDRRIMLTIIDKFEGGPIGLETLATVVCEEKNTLEDVYEPFLIQSGFIKRTPRGRVATTVAYEHFKRKTAFLDGPKVVKTFK